MTRSTLTVASALTHTGSGCAYSRCVSDRDHHHLPPWQTTSSSPPLSATPRRHPAALQPASVASRPASSSSSSRGRPSASPSTSRRARTPHACLSMRRRSSTSALSSRPSQVLQKTSTRAPIQIGSCLARRLPSSQYVPFFLCYRCGSFKATSYPSYPRGLACLAPLEIVGPFPYSCTNTDCLSLLIYWCRSQTIYLSMDL